MTVPIYGQMYLIVLVVFAVGINKKAPRWLGTIKKYIYMKFQSKIMSCTCKQVLEIKQMLQIRFYSGVLSKTGTYKGQTEVRMNYKIGIVRL